MRFNQSLFIDDDHITTHVNDWVLKNNRIVSYSIYRPPVLDFLPEISIYFMKDFTGKWTYEIVATDELNQTCTIQIDIFVSPWAQTDWIKCSGPAQNNWTLCKSGYEIEKETGAWLQISYLNPFKNTSNLFIKLLVLLNLVLSIVTMILKMPIEVSKLTILTNQMLLISCLFSRSPSNDMLDFLSILQLTKMDLKFLDLIFRSRSFMNSLFYKKQFVSLNQFNFETGSTMANFCNLLYFLLAYFIILLLWKLIRRWVSKSNVENAPSYIFTLSAFFICFCIDKY